MREIPAALQAKLDGGATTLARCWRVTRRDGVVMGFTDHDRALSFDGVDYEPEAGFGPSAVERTTGLSADTHEVAGALSSERIDPADIARGAYDGAEVAVWLVDWEDPSVRLLLSRGLIGEIRRGESLFEAEVTGLSDRLGQPFGRAYIAACSARLGDAACGVDLTRPGYRGSGTVLAVAGPQLVSASGLAGFARDWFTGGRLVWTSGANAGLDGHVKAHPVAGVEAVVELWLSPPMQVAPGDGFEIFAGCDRTAGTCRAKFDNIVNLRGFPHMPGDDAVAGYPATGGVHDGGSLFRR
jgi:uncharacterized phage protein (TIGR02218 family)